MALLLYVLWEYIKMWVYMAYQMHIQVSIWCPPWHIGNVCLLVSSSSNQKVFHTVYMAIILSLHWTLSQITRPDQWISFSHVTLPSDPSLSRSQTPAHLQLCMNQSAHCSQVVESNHGPGIGHVTNLYCQSGGVTAQEYYNLLCRLRHLLIFVSLAFYIGPEFRCISQNVAYHDIRSQHNINRYTSY